MSDQGLAIFSPFKIALVVGFTFLAWGDLVHGDQIALMVETLVIGLYLNDLYSKRNQIMSAKRLTFSEFLKQVKHDWNHFSIKLWFLSFFDTSTEEAKKRYTLNLIFMGIILTPAIMSILRFNESVQESILTFGFVLWSLWFIVTNVKEFLKTRELKRLLFSNIGVYFLICSLVLVL